MEKIKIVISGAGGVGCLLVKLLKEKKGIEIAGIYDVDPEKIGKEFGEVANCDPIGVEIYGNLELLLDKVKPDVIINTPKASSAKETFYQMKPAIVRGINVLVANMGTCNLWSTEPELASEVDELTKKFGVSYLGIGATQMQDRFILSQTEGCSKIDNITFTHFADIHAFSDYSVRKEWGVLLSEEDFKKGIEEGSIAEHEYFKEGLYYLGAHLGWNIDDVTYSHLPMIEKGFVYGVHFQIKGFSNRIQKLETNWIFLRDPERKYYDQVQIEGTPKINSMNIFTPDRGMVSTIAVLTNAIPIIIKSKPGYINSLELQSCTMIDDDFRNHI